MKKSALLLGAIFLVGCSTDSPSTTDCDCGVVIQRMYYNIPDNNGGVIVQSTITVRNNCTQLTKTVSGISGIVQNGSQWCN